MSSFTLGAEIGPVAVLYTWDRASTITRMSTASFRAAAYPRTAHAGLPASPASSCRSACFQACSGAASAQTSTPHQGQPVALLSSDCNAH
jgi:hypothetical protein